MNDSCVTSAHMAPHRPESLPRYPPGFRVGPLHYLGIRNPDRQDKTLWYVVSVGSILNQSRLSSLGHHHSDLPEISFLLFTTRTPVDVSAVLQLSLRNASFALTRSRPSSTPPPLFPLTFSSYFSVPAWDAAYRSPIQVSPHWGVCAFNRAAAGEYF